MTLYKPDSFDTTSISFDRVALRYDGTQDVFSDVSFELTKGSFTFLTGNSGAGKTSLLKLIYLALRPSAGDIYLFGQRTHHLKRRQLSALRRRIGIIFQEFRLLDHLSAYENAALPLRIRGQKERDYRPDVEELLRWVGLGKRLHARPATLSGGEKQRIAIARALVNKPDLLIADEPTGNVDPEMSLRLMRLFAELNKRMGTSVLMATHDKALLGSVPGSVLTLHNGLIVKQNVAEES